MHDPLEMKTHLSPPAGLAIRIAGFLALFLLFGAILAAMRPWARPRGVDATRINQRRTDLAEIQARAREELTRYAFLDPAKGIVRLPIARAMELVCQEWQQPAAARSNLLARLEKALAPAPNPYE